MHQISNSFQTQTPDEAALSASVEGIPYPNDFYEVVYANEKNPDIAKLFPFSVFPATRTLYRSKTFTVIRLYMGSAQTTAAQQDTLARALSNDWILDCIRAWIDGSENEVEQ